MRARLAEAWPALGKHFGLKPWHAARLSEAEVRVYLDALKDIAWQARKR